MSGNGSPPPQRVPTLTEVVDWPDATPLPSGSAGDAQMAEADVIGNATQPPFVSVLTEEQIVQRVLGEVQRQVDLMLEYRLREVLTPLLTRATDGLIRESRSELASALRDEVARAVAQELARHRTR